MSINVSGRCCRCSLLCFLFLSWSKVLASFFFLQISAQFHNSRATFDLASIYSLSFYGRLIFAFCCAWFRPSTSQRFIAVLLHTFQLPKTGSAVYVSIVIPILHSLFHGSIRNALFWSIIIESNCYWGFCVVVVVVVDKHCCNSEHFETTCHIRLKGHSLDNNSNRMPCINLVTSNRSRYYGWQTITV